MDDATSKPPQGAPAKPPVSARSGDHSICSRQLLGNQKLLLIDHRGEVYRLMETRSGKLILHK